VAEDSVVWEAGAGAAGAGVAGGVVSPPAHPHRRRIVESRRAAEMGFICVFSSI
jgi:hypothetical protein